MVLLYDSNSPCNIVNGARKKLFAGKGKTVENIPPTQDALLQHVHCSVPLIKGVISGVSLCSCNLNYQVPVTGAGVQLITVGILCGRQYLMQLNVAQS